MIKRIKRIFLDNFLTPIKAMRLRYLPLLMIYFAYGASTLGNIALTFWVKEELALTAPQLTAIAVWLSLPWTIKMVFGQFADSISIFGSQRKVYVYIGASLMAIGYSVLAATAAKVPFVLALGSPGSLYVFSMMVVVVGLVMQDVVADTMTTEVVERKGRRKKDIETDLGMIQVLGRLSLSFAAFLVAGLGGYLASTFEYHQVFLMLLVIPIISIIGVSLIRLDAVPKKPVNWLVLGGGFGFVIFSAIMGLSSIPYGQEIVFVVSFAVLCYLVRSIIKDIKPEIKRLIIFSFVVLFVFRATPDVGPGVQWWMIDDLGFSKDFFGVLAQIGATLAIFGMWFFAKYITQKPVQFTLVWLTIITTVLALPIIGMYYGLHDYLGVAPQTIALIDTAAEAPFVQLSIIPLLTLIAIYAPPGNAATWFALMASLMNLALNAGGLLTKYLNMIFVVERGNYEELGHLMITSSTIGFVVPLLIIFLFMTKRGNRILTFWK